MIKIEISGSTNAEIIEGVVNVFYLLHDAQADEIQERLRQLTATPGLREKQSAIADQQGLAPPEKVQPPTQQVAQTAVPTAVPTATKPVYDRTQISVACTGLIDSDKEQEFLNLLHNDFGVQAITELKDEQLDSFVLAIRQLGAAI